MRLASLSAALAALLVLPSRGPAEPPVKPIELRLSSWFDVEHPHHKNVLMPWARMVEQRSGRRLKITIHPSGVLGKPADHWDMIKDGTVDIGWGAHNYTPQRFPLTGVVSLPFLFQTAKGASRALWELYPKDLQREHAGVKVLWLFAHGPGQLFMTQTPVKTLEDLVGRKVRVPGGQVAAILRTLGAEPVTMPAPETYAALKNGSVDGTVYGWDAIVGFKLADVIRYHTVANLYSSPFFFAMNQRKYDSLPPDLRKVIDDLSGVWGAEFSGAGWDKGDLEGIAAAKKARGTIYTLPPAERERWIRKAAVVQSAWVASLEGRGLPARRVLGDLKELIKRFDP